VTAFTGEGARLFQVGTPGVAGNGTAPGHIQFDHVADAFVETGIVGPAMPPDSPYGPSYIYTSDGDGGTDNRVLKIAVPALWVGPGAEGGPEAPEGEGARGVGARRAKGPTVEWATSAIFDNPHSITKHHSGLLVVADREHNATKLLDSRTGKDLGTWDCGLHFGAEGRPFGVRAMQFGGVDMVIVASMDNVRQCCKRVLSAAALTTSPSVTSLPFAFLCTYIPLFMMRRNPQPAVLSLSHNAQK
jgi:hypothetical protein